MKKASFTEYQHMAFASEAHFKSVPTIVRIQVKQSVNSEQTANERPFKRRRDIEYVYTVELRKTKWSREQVTATSIVEVARMLKVKLDDLRYITKERAR